MAEQAADDGSVKYSVKELLVQVNTRLGRIEDKLDTKADKNLVDILAQKIEAVSARIPEDLIKEHARIVMQMELNKQHNDWLDDQLKNSAVEYTRLKQNTADNTFSIKEIDKVQRIAEGSAEQAQNTRRWILGLVLGNIAQLAYTTYALIHGFH